MALGPSARVGVRNGGSVVKGTVTIDDALCKGCGLCVPVCPKGLLALSGERFNARGVHPVELHDETGRCTGCEVCATMCPEAAIAVYRLMAAA
jgi:2-oxoglutarate ferredoxin oxidoreductase subunit delta